MIQFFRRLKIKFTTKGTKIGKGVFIDKNVKIGNYCFIGNNTVIRSNCKFEDHVVIGHLVLIEEGTYVGEKTTIQSQCHITSKMTIGKSVFFGPSVVSGNDKVMLHNRRHVQQFVKNPPIVGDGARIAMNAIICPGVKIGKECVILAGSLIRADTEPFHVYKSDSQGYIQKLKKVEEEFTIFKEEKKEVKNETND